MHRLQHVFHLIKKLILLTLSTSACLPVYSAHQNQYHSVEEYITNQKMIRIFADDMPGFGNQTASRNVTVRLRAMGFNGRFQFYYLEDAQQKIMTIFNLPKQISDIYFDKEQNIEFIKINSNDWIFHVPTHDKIHVKEHVPLGLAGALDHSYRHCFDFQAPICKYAKIMNVTFFIKLSPYVFDENIANNLKDYLSTRIYNEQQDQPFIQKGSLSKYYTMPITSLAEAKQFLENNETGKILLSQKPAIKTLIEGIEKHQFNILSLYGYPFLKRYPTYSNDTNENNNRNKDSFPGNILQVITAARYAQLNGPKAFQKPLVIPIFYDYTNEAKELVQLIHSNDWDSYEKPGAEYAKQAIQLLNLQNNFFITDIGSQEAISRMKTLKDGQILLVSMGPLPPTVFDGIYIIRENNERRRDI